MDEDRSSRFSQPAGQVVLIRHADAYHDLDADVPDDDEKAPE
jgi:hypothetical protein